MIRSLIIDDEVKSRLLIRKMLTDHCPEVEIIGEAGTVEEGLILMRERKPQLLFLDIEMGDGNGFDLIRETDAPDFHIIFISAHSNYAVRAFKYSAVDYVLKPVDIDDLVFAVKKVAALQADDKKETASLDFLNIRTGRETIYLKPSDIVRIEAESSYSRVYTSDGQTYVVSQNLGAIEPRLDDRMFMRIHKSEIINLSYLKKFHDAAVSFAELTDGTMVAVSRRSKDLLKKKLNL